MIARLSVKNIIPPDVLYLEFTLAEPLNFLPGQFFRLTLINPPESDNRGNSRFFGFVNSPSQNSSVSMFTHIGVSTFKKHLNSISLGSEVEISDPRGNMTLPDDYSKPLVFITSDVGIAPYFSILRYIQEKSLPYRITLINLPPVIPQSDLATYAGVNQNIKLLAPDSLDLLFLRDQFPQHGNLLFYISGLPRFVTNTVRILHDWDLPPAQMKFEIFTGY